MSRRMCMTVLSVATVSAALCVAGGLPSAEIDRGGVTFDFPADSARLFAEPKDDHPVAVRCTVPDATDGSFFIGQGQCGYLWVEMKNVSGAKYDADRFECRLTLPAGIELVAERSRGVRVPIANFNVHDPMGYLVRATRGKGEAGEATFVCFYEGKPVSRTGKLKIVVTDPVKAIRPKRFMTGIHGSARLAEFPKADAVECFADFLAESGVSWGVIDCSPQVRDVLQARGIRVTPYDNNYFVNGFMVGHYQGRPESDRYVPLPLKLQPPDATSQWFLSKGSCPIAIYTESDFFRTNTVPLLRADCEGYDGFWANWEPYFYANRGCFCERCKSAFAEYAHIPLEKLAADNWYDLVRTAKAPYRVPWLEFRAREHGRVVRTIDKYVRRFTRPDSFGFVPGVCWIEMSSWYPPIQDAYASYAKQVRQVDFAGDLRWINPWGPYPCWSISKPYQYQKGRSMQSFFAAKDVREQVAKDYPADKRPKLLAFPLGNLGGMVPQPEWVEMGIDSFFFHRWEAAVVYFMPRGGLDARYWRAFAQATTRAAKYEDIVFDGRPVTETVEVSPVVEYAASCDKVTDYLPEKTKDQPLLQRVAYAKDGVTAVAVFNFWEKGEAFFDLRIAGLSGSFRIVDEDGVVWTKDARHANWTAAELARGIRLEVGAARTRVFEIRPAQRPLVGARSLRTAAETETRLQTRRTTLAASAAEDGAAAKAAGSDVDITVP